MRDGILALLTITSALSCLSLARICYQTWRGTHNHLVRSLEIAFLALGGIYGFVGALELMFGTFDNPYPPFTYWRPFAVRGGPAIVFLYLVWTLKRGR